jgi:hypothetical protein
MRTSSAPSSVNIAASLSVPTPQKVVVVVVVGWKGGCVVCVGKAVFLPQTHGTHGCIALQMHIGFEAAR